MAFQGALKELPLPDIIQLVSVSGKTGMFLLRSGEATGEIYLHDGQIVHARVGELTGEEAVYELAIWREGEFIFTPGKDTAEQTIHKSNTNLLMEAARRIDEWQVLSKKIPSTRVVPVFTNQANMTSVSLTPQEWSLICKVDERRTIEEVALAMGTSPFEVCKLIYGLLTSGLLALKESLDQLRTDRIRRMSVEELKRLVEQIHAQSREMLAGHEKLAELDGIYRLSRTELEGGRGFDAVIDLVRADEKVVSAALGPHQSKAFLDRIGRLLGAA
jgi:hypothetical protein